MVISSPAQYRVVLAYYRQLIESGQLPLGERLPGIDAVRTEFGVGRHIVTMAWRELTKLGLVYRSDPRARPVVQSATPRRL